MDAPPANAAPAPDPRRRILLRAIAIGVPLLGWATWESGPVVGLLLLAAGASILRWPVVFFWRWLRRQVG